MDFMERRDKTRQLLQTAVGSIRGFLGIPTKEPFLRYLPKSVSRDSIGVIVGCEWSEEYFEKPSLSLAVLLLNQYCSNSPDYAALESTISDLYGKPRDSFQNALKSFLLESLVGDSKKGTDTLLDDLEGKACRWEVKAMVVGIVPESQITLSENVILRKVAETDLVYELPAGARLLSAREIWPLADSILEATLYSRYPGPVQRRIDSLCLSLSLYKETGAYWISCSFNPNSYLQFGAQLTGGSTVARQPRAVIKEDDYDSLNRFVRNYESRIPKAVIESRPVDPLEVSMKRYIDSIRGNLPVEERLTYAVMGLEAILLENETEQRFRLSLRAAQVLRYLNEDPSMVYSIVREAYGYRSSHVHGAILSDDARMKAQQALNMIWSYLRKVLLYTLADGIISQAKKKEFLKEVDRALIDDSARRNLEGKILVAKGLMTGAV